MQESGDIWEVFRRQHHWAWWLTECWAWCWERGTVEGFTQSCDLGNLGTWWCFSERYRRPGWREVGRGDWGRWVGTSWVEGAWDKEMVMSSWPLIYQLGLRFSCCYRNPNHPKEMAWTRQEFFFSDVAVWVWAACGWSGGLPVSGICFPYSVVLTLLGCYPHLWSKVGHQPYILGSHMEGKSIMGRAQTFVGHVAWELHASLPLRAHWPAWSQATGSYKACWEIWSSLWVTMYLVKN